eukprot:CAMPEP_0201917554 /NCGR_PEP_ID=MMETSP0903-20130614/6921_1 /ASSEMBLY_ACC=CAM_ASM_000552 /TAXON_ID=420261 /ORGANISM="Thalassiosira antarctica, Strain CCMP982" /LENGTH=606 /DNA_ID=CAMNT_0048453635 /DNA_START=37 /DNA_END=1854 /DNA_ORIENTATION=+
MSSSPYNGAGSLLNEHLENHRGLKSIAFDTKSKNGKGKKKAPDMATYATVCKTMQHLSTINGVLDANNKKLRKAIGFDVVRNKGLLYVLIYELLFGKYKSIRGGGQIKRMIVKHETELRHEAEEYISEHGGVPDSSGGNNVKFPRYVRVNTLRSNVSDIVDKLKEDLSSKMAETNTRNHDNDTEEKKSPSIYADAHVPDLLVLPPTASSLLHRDNELVKSGKIVLQDKSSCFSALVLAQGLGGNTKEEKLESFDYIDACAAPGNKTSHLAALVHSSIGDVDQPKKKKKGKANSPKSTIFAFDRAESRFDILQERMGLLVPSAADNGNKVAVVPIHGDFLKADPSDPKFAKVRAIMLDPSCSGSGIVNSPDRWMEEVDDDKDKKRIQSLSNFQVVALKHAMSFPNVDRIVYSTCSVHEEENEGVVSKALSEAEKLEDGNEWELMAPVCLEHWPRRGKEGGIGGLTKSQADCLVRCNGLEGDETNGFFVSFFVRKKVSLSTGPETSRMAIENAGIPVYDGQFLDMCKKSEAPVEVARVAKKVDIKEATKNQKQQVQTQKNEPSSVKATDKTVKKREKKLAWKRKQALQKTQRMKKKEGAAKATTKDVK